MIDMNDMDDMNDTRREVTSLTLPIQAAPVYRTTVGGARTGSGVEPSDWFDALKTALDIGGKVASVW